jgi:hypothetical protein
MHSVPKPKKVIGRAEKIDLPERGLVGIPARIDTGANTTSIWASNVHESDGLLYFTLFDEGSPLYTGEELEAEWFERINVASSMGHEQERYKIRLLIKLKGKRIRARVTLADRSTQTYPVLIGRNVLRGKFIVDVSKGNPLYQEERQRSEALQSKLAPKEQ